MRACGALFVKTRRANNFTRRILATARETLARDFVSADSRKRYADDSHLTAPQAQYATGCEDLEYLVLAVSLLQMIGIFHQESGERSMSSLYHGMLVMVG